MGLSHETCAMHTSLSNGRTHNQHISWPTFYGLPALQLFSSFLHLALFLRNYQG